jgi:hypothetical protein
MPAKNSITLKIRIIISLILLVVLNSCSKNNNDNNNNNNSNAAYSLKFKANGILYEFSGKSLDDPNADEAAITNDFGGSSSINGVETTYPEQYTLFGYDGENFLRIAFLKILSGNKLQKGTYNLSNFDCDVRLEDIVYYPGVNGIVTITSDANNKFSGTFSGTLKYGHNSGGNLNTSQNPISITEGTFENIPFLPNR